MAMSSHAPTWKREFTVAELAVKLSGTVEGRGDLVIRGVNSLDEAQSDDLAFISNEYHAKQWGHSKAAAAIITDRLEATGHDAKQRALIIVRDAEIGMITALEHFQPPEALPDLGVHPTAVVHSTTSLGNGVRIAAHVWIDHDCTLGDGVVLHPGVRLYAGVEIGEGSVVHANTVIRHNCRIGRRVILNQNVSIGADGFGYRPDPSGAGLIKVPHVGSVIIEDDVEIGANSCVDRGKFGATVIGAGTKIDNLCQIGHNTQIGRCCLMAGQSGLAGSVVVGDGVLIGGQAGIIDHLTIGNGCEIGAKAAVLQSMPPGAHWTGYPAGDGKAMLRQWVAMRKIPDLIRRLSRQFPAANG